MTDRRKTQKNHIRAARDWLGEAEHSLEHENDIQGDLKLMLARAELSQVPDSHRSAKLKCWGLRLLPLLAAMMLVLAGMWLMQKPAVDMSSPVPAESAADETPAARAEKQDTPLPETGEQQPDAAPSVPVASAPASMTAEPEAEAVPVKPTVPAGQVPDAEKQRLMQSAGKVLRQQ